MLRSLEVNYSSVDKESMYIYAKLYFYEREGTNGINPSIFISILAIFYHDKSRLFHIRSKLVWNESYINKLILFNYLYATFIYFHIWSL